MYNQQYKILVSTLMVFDAVIMTIAGYLAYFISLELSNGYLAMSWNDFILFLVVANNYFMGRFGLYSDRRFSSTVCMIKNLSRAVILSFIFLTAGGLMLGIESFSATYLITHFLMAISLLTIVRSATKFYFDQRAIKAFNSHTILIAGPGDRITSIIDALNLQRSWGHTIAGWISVNGRTRSEIKCIPHLGTLDDFGKILCEHPIDEVIFDLPRSCCIDLKKYLRKCEEVGVIFRIVPGFFNIQKPCLKAENIQDIPTLFIHTRAISATSLLYKKILDLFVGSIGFLIFLILYPFIMLAIKIESPGPVLFKQLRIGLNGRRFYLYKFRSMCVGAESQKNALLKNCEAPWPEYTCKVDPRISRVGRFLRKTSIDEIPQFINILKGEMSLVGTRPPTPDEFKYYDDWHRRRISLKPGLTGLWQISGRKEIKDFNQVVKLDLEYIDNYRFQNDLLILWKTLWTVLAQKGAG